MTTRLFAILALFFLTVLNSYSQKNKATVIMRDGSKISGLAKITMDEKIKFRKHKDSAKVKYDYKTVQGVVLDQHDGTVEYQYKIVKGRSPKLYRVITRGKLSLFAIKQVNSGAPMMGTNGSFRMGGPTYTTFYYYLGKDDSHLIEYFVSDRRGFKHLRKQGAKLFKKSCPKLLDKINNKEFTADDILKIVEFYNYNCN